MPGDQVADALDHPLGCLPACLRAWLREFNLADTIRLWDSLFADRQRSDFVLYFCLAMLIEQRHELLQHDFAHNLRLLQSYPDVDVQPLLDR